jgi:predicted O-methyltransferase YrrM
MEDEIVAAPALKLNVFIAFPAYGSNGSCATEHPDIREWAVETVLKMKADPRIGEIAHLTVCETPAPMVRNYFVRKAREAGAHLLLSIDSDQSPNKHAKEPGFKPFWDEAFEFIYSRYHKGPHVVGAPYCGPPGAGENVYVFRWDSFGNRGDEPVPRLEQYTRAEAAKLAGIQECAALPTGLILYDMRAFDLIEPSAMPKREILEKVASGEISPRDADFMLRQGFYYYEYKNQYADEKISTEDVTNTRDIAMVGAMKLGYNPIHCAWDSWVGHWKPANVGKPDVITTEHIGEVFKQAVIEDRRANEKQIDVELPDWAKRQMESLAQRRTALTDLQYGIKSNGHSNGHAPKPAAPPWATAHHTHEVHKSYLAGLIQGYAEEIGRVPRVLEVGTWLGETAIAMADAGAEVTCVDTFEGSPGEISETLAGHAGGADAVYEEFKKRIGDRFNKSIFPYRKSSADAAAMSWPKMFDIIFIDAAHNYEAVLEDIHNWWKHLRVSGCLVGHDYDVPQFPEVKEAADDAFGEAIKEVAICEEGSLWLVEKCPGVAPKKLETASA